MEVKDNLIQLEVVYSKLNKALDENINRLNIGATAVENYNKKISVIPSEFQKSLVDIKTKTDAVTISSKKLEQQSTKESNARNALNKQREQAIAQLEKENSKLAAAQSLYNKTNAQLKTVQMAYDNLALKKARYNNLTDNEEKRLVTLTNTLQKYRTVQDGVNTTVGKFQQRVGDYARSGFNPLSNSINQLTREMPAFTYSVQTGFMALSNNIPIFTDAIGNAVRANKELIAQGQPTTSVFKQIAGALLSFQTLMGVGITLLTVYGKEIGEFLVGSESKKKAIEAEKKAIEDKQKAEEEAFQTTASYQSDELSRSRILFENAKNLSLSYKERLKAVTELKDRYPEYLKNLSNEQILAGQTADAEERLNIALIGRGYALAAQQLLQKNIEKEMTLSLKNAQNEAVLLQKFHEDMKKRSGEVVIYKDREKAAQVQAESIANKTRQNQSNAYREQVKQLRAEREAILLQYNEYSKYLGVVNETSSAKKELAKTEEELLKFGTEAWLNAQISALTETRSKTAKSSDAYREIGGAIAYYQKWLETLTGAQKKSNEENEKTLKYGTIPYYEKLQEEIKALQLLVTDTSGEEYARLQKQIDFYQALINAIRGVKEETKEAEKVNTDYLDSFIDSFSSESGFSKTFDILRGNIKDFGKDATTTALAVSEAFQEAFNTIAQASQANFEAEYSRLELQKEVALQFAGESSTAKEEIERQYEEKRKAIARRQAESEKRLAIFNIGINTAQAIMATYAKLGFPKGIPLAIAMGVIGAAQIAMVSAKEIPQFWRGTENAPEGWALTQEKGAEVITDKYGKVKSYGSDKGAQMTYLNRGDKVYNAQKSEAYINKELAKNGIMPMRQSIINNNENNSLSKDDFNNGISKLAKTFKSQQPSSNTQVFLNNKQINTDYYKGKKV